MRMNIQRALAHSGIDPEKALAIIYFDPGVQRHRYYALRADALHALGVVVTLERYGRDGVKVIKAKPMIDTGEMEEVDVRAQL